MFAHLTARSCPSRWRVTGLKDVVIGGQTVFRPTAILVRQRLYMSQVAHQAGTHPGFSSMKRLGAFLLPPEWDASPSEGYSQH